MNMHDLRALRPAERTSHAVISALSRIKARAAIVAERVGELLAGRPEKLLSADTDEVEALERDLAAARLEAEQLAALEAAVAADLPALQEAELAEQLRRECAALVSRRPAVVRAVTEEYPKLARRIVEICEAERAYVQDALRFKAKVKDEGNAGINVPVGDLSLGYARSMGRGGRIEWLFLDLWLPGIGPMPRSLDHNIPPILGPNFFQHPLSSGWSRSERPGTIG